MRKQSSGQAFRITGARQGLSEDVRGRQRRYVISMVVRTVAVVLTVVLWNVERPIAIATLVLGLALPYIAVVIANAGRENAPSLPSTFVAGADQADADAGRRRRSGGIRSRSGRRRTLPPLRMTTADHHPVCKAQEKLRSIMEFRCTDAPSPVTYCVRAPHPPSERRTDAGRLPPWLPGVVMSATALRCRSRARGGECRT